jgi:hypothetical protein
MLASADGLSLGSHIALSQPPRPMTGGKAIFPK